MYSLAYVRFDESTARPQRALGARLEQEMPEHFNAVKCGAEHLDDFQQWMLTFDGIGPKTVEKFFCEAKAELNSSATR